MENSFDKQILNILMMYNHKPQFAKKQATEYVNKLMNGNKITVDEELELTLLIQDFEG